MSAPTKPRRWPGFEVVAPELSFTEHGRTDEDGPSGERALSPAMEALTGGHRRPLEYLCRLLEHGRATEAECIAAVRDEIAAWKGHRTEERDNRSRSILRDAQAAASPAVEVTQLLRRLGRRPDEMFHKGRQTPDDVIAVLHDLYELGMTDRAIVETLAEAGVAIDPKTVRRRCNGLLRGEKAMTARSLFGLALEIKRTAEPTRPAPRAWRVA